VSIDEDLSVVAPISEPAPLGELAARAAARHGASIAQRFPVTGGWAERSYADVAAQVEQLAAGLYARGVRAGDRVALLCRTRPEWTIADLAICRLGAICVPVYPTSSRPEIEWVLADSGATLVIVEDDPHAEHVAALRGRLPQLRDVLGVATSEAAGLVTLASITSDAVLPQLSVDASAPFTIVYTSGTTGNPKGCQLTHANVAYLVDALATVTDLGAGDVIYIYLPLAHLLTRAVQIYAFETGATIAYSGGDIRQVITELAEVRPTHLPSVPQLFEKVHDKISAYLATLPDDQQQAIPRTFEMGARVRRAQQAGLPLSGPDRAVFEEAEQQLFSLVRAAFGGRLREAITGAAPIAPQILEFFYACGVPIYEGYGMTESTALISANSPSAVKIGTVGRPAPGLALRIDEDGEICVRGSGVFAGYWNNPDASAETIVDGWLHTGDLGELDADGYLSITGPKKDIIITAAGKNLTPANLENDLRRSRWITNAVMLGDRRPYPVALITVDADEVQAWAAQTGLSGELAPLCETDELRALIGAVVDEVNQRYAPPERIRRFAILPTEFSIEAGELTPTLKIRRAVLTERHADLLDELYCATP
jgi:long-chain acyl-CoA synthetase